MGPINSVNLFPFPTFARARALQGPTDFFRSDLNRPGKEQPTMAGLRTLSRYQGSLPPRKDEKNIARPGRRAELPTDSWEIIFRPLTIGSVAAAVAAAAVAAAAVAATAHHPPIYFIYPCLSRLLVLLRPIDSAADGTFLLDAPLWECPEILLGPVLGATLPKTLMAAASLYYIL
jgi:hypothetical protein